MDNYKSYSTRLFFYFFNLGPEYFRTEKKFYSNDFHELDIDLFFFLNFIKIKIMLNLLVLELGWFLSLKFSIPSTFFRASPNRSIGSDTFSCLGGEVRYFFYLKFFFL